MISNKSANIKLRDILYIFSIHVGGRNKFSIMLISDDYMTAPMDMMTSADEDPHNMSTGSFSENAWDNYQVLFHISDIL